MENNIYNLANKIYNFSEEDFIDWDYKDPHYLTPKHRENHFYMELSSEFLNDMLLMNKPSVGIWLSLLYIMLSLKISTVSGTLNDFCLGLMCNEEDFKTAAIIIQMEITNVYLNGAGDDLYTYFFRTDIQPEDDIFTFKISQNMKKRIYTKAEKGFIAPKIRYELLKKYNFTCQYCGREAPYVSLEIDHIIPRSKGGTNEIKNLIVSCWECNIGKSDSL